MNEGLSGLTQKAPLLMAPRPVLNDAVAQAAQHAPHSACALHGRDGALVDRHGDLHDPGGGPADLAGDPVDPWRDHGILPDIFPVGADVIPVLLDCSCTRA